MDQKIRDRIWLLTDDISNTRQSLIGNKPKGVLYSYLMVPEDEERLSRLRVLLTAFDTDPNITAIVSHDAEAIASSGMELWNPDAVARPNN
ncbi:hypothetical protein [Parerythrobacter jejuensis]|uniref:Uncharacterized protein n=1 Tax=Parerythrobacter jejuensis TaxID=795812 RepID=A0A845ART9_9SPHN|nr:hypothetical protein [Parerythrobacter jejuensis]MXP32304.1 hypothetical protein [Parerythrobacter jejuensis]